MSPHPVYEGNRSGGSAGRVAVGRVAKRIEIVLVRLMVDTIDSPAKSHRMPRL